MTRQTIPSPGMKSIGWEDFVLEIEYADGTIRQYKDVSFAEYCGFMNRASLGSSLTEFLKKHPG